MQSVSLPGRRSFFVALLRTVSSSSRRRKRFQKALAQLERAVYGVIESRRMGEGDGGPNLLTRLLEARDEEGEGMSNRQLRDEVMTLFFAGHDTTSTAAAWTLGLLAKNPQWRERVCEEARGLGDPLSAEDLAAMPITDRVIKETLRLYPPGWLTVRTPYADDTILGYHVPKDAPLLISQWVIHRHPDHWSTPGWTK